MKIKKGQWALVTGASSGIGKSYAERLASDGVNLVLVARTESMLQKLAADLKAKHQIEALVLAKDLSRLSAAEEIFKSLDQKGVNIDILINNAGFAVYGKLHETDFKKNQEQLMLNVVSLSSLTQLFVEPMAKRNSGIVINVASTAGFQPLPYMANYGASKGFVRQFTEALWAEYKDQGVQFLAVCPGSTETNFFKIVNAEEASVGKRDTPENVVNESFKALEAGRIYIIPGSVSNFLLSQLGRLVTHKFSSKLTEKVMRPRNNKKTHIR